MLGSFVVMYLFLGGCGAGVLLVAAAWSLLFHRTRTRSRAQSRAFDGLMGILAAIAFVLLAVSAFCLLLDLGRPQRFFLLFTRPTPSLLTFGSFVLLASLGVSGVLAAAHLVAPRVVSEPLRIALEGAAVVLAFALMVYTALHGAHGGGALVEQCRPARAARPLLGFLGGGGRASGCPLRAG